MPLVRDDVDALLVRLSRDCAGCDARIVSGRDDACAGVARTFRSRKRRAAGDAKQLHTIDGDGCRLRRSLRIDVVGLLSGEGWTQGQKGQAYD
jgi:hypothetical protein